MNNILKNILAVVLGIILGSAVNMAIVYIGPFIITPPNGADTTTMESIKATMHLFETKHYITPFVAHALGTLTGAYVAAFVAATHKMKLAFAIGVWFLIGGITMVYLLPSPMWFNVVDLVFAYIPMAYIGGKLSTRN